MELETGKAYFEITWATNETQVPDIESYIYIGKNIFGGAPEEHFFQTSYSFEKHGNFAELKDQNVKSQAEIILMRPEMAGTLYSISGVIGELRKLEKDHGEAFGILRKESNDTSS